MTMTPKAAGIYELAILSRVLRPSQGALSPEAARSILMLDFDPRDRERMHELAQKAQAGSLDQEEQQEIDSYERVSHLLGLLRSKARVSLRTQGEA